MTDKPLLDPRDIVILNAARTILANLAADAPHTWDGGVIMQAAKTAENAVFQAINVTNVYGEQGMTEAELHNGKTDLHSVKA